MRELDDLKAIWKSQNLSADDRAETIGRGFLDKLEKQRKVIRRSNIVATVCMVFVISWVSWIGFHFDGQEPLFYLAIGTVIVLSVVANLLIWMRSLKKTAVLSMNSRTYVDFQLKRLKWSRHMIAYSPLYGFVLGIVVNAYVYSLIGEEASPFFVFWLVNSTWVYIMLAIGISYVVKMRKFNRNVEPLIRELEKIKSGLD